MALRQIISFLAALALAGCGGNPPPAPAAAGNGSGAASAASVSSGPIGFIGPNGLQVAATPEINHALDTAITNQPASWTEAESGAVTQFTALRTFQRDDNAYCRGFTQAVTKGSSTETAHGLACQTPDGTWQAVSG